MNTPGFNIAAVERDTGLSKDVLRMWERRYGFPIPERDANGERVYPAEQVERLRLIKRLMNQGHRPGKLIATPPEQLAQVAPRRPAPRPESAGHGDTADREELLGFIKRNDVAGFQQALQQRLIRQGLLRFVLDTVAPLTHRVGEAWVEGSIQVFEEHLFTELTKRLLRQTISGLPVSRQQPRILLTSAPDEEHALGLLMIEALLALEGAVCIPLGTRMPLPEIAKAAVAHRADIVALSFSSAFASRRIPGLLQQLRDMLPPQAELWVGGSGVAHLAPLAGVRVLPSLEHGIEALAEWERRRA